VVGATQFATEIQMATKQKLTAFLSHSSKDKSFVRRLNSDLRSHSIETWLDEQNIPLGGSITESIEAALSEARVVLVFLSEAAVTSRWVTTEWQSKFFKQINDQRIMIIPILLSDCEIPNFLADRRYLDFRRQHDYESNLSILLSFLAKIAEDEAGKVNDIGIKNSGSIFEITLEILSDLEREQISLPVHKRLPIIDTLKLLPRSGKRVRLQNFRPTVKVRSIYDHLLSLAHIADAIVPCIRHGIAQSELSDIALCIAYHELNEVVLGDIPTYTSLTTNKRNSARIYAEERLRTVTPSDRKKISNDFIWMFLSDKHRRAFEASNRIMSEIESPTYIIFKSLDKIDPIVTVWRYIHYYRGRLGKDPREFNRVMKDFYENPDVKSYLRANKVDARLVDMVLNLQDRRKAWDYYENPRINFRRRGAVSDS
jgi:5'-deoxynucleotidase YfbR-like HD superfamily hydrolase